MAVDLSGVPRVMGEGLAGLERLLPSERSVLLFGETHARVVPAAAVAATKHVGQLVQRTQEQRHNWFERVVYLPPEKARREARRSQAAGVAAGVATSVVVSAAISGARWYMERKHAENVAGSVLSIVAFAALDEDGTLGDPNAALLARVLDAFGLSERVRARVSARPLPTEVSALPDTGLQGQARDALARYVFHALGPQIAESRIVPLLIRLGMGQSEASHFAQEAHQEYLSEQDTLSFHYAVLQSVVGGIGLHLEVPLDEIREAALRVTAFNPYEAGRAANRRLLAGALSGGFMLAGVPGVGFSDPALSIAASAASLLFGRADATGRTLVGQALDAYVNAQ